MKGGRSARLAERGRDLPLAEALREAVRKGARAARIGGALAVTAVAVACAAAGWAAPVEGAASRTVEPGAAGQPFDFPILLYRGESVLGAGEMRFSEVLALGKPVVLNMWAGLCPPCRAEMPHFQTVYGELGDRFVLIGLDIGTFVGLGDRKDAIALVDDLGITFPVGSTNRAEVVTEYGVLGMPSTFFVKPDGSIFRQWTGPLDVSGLRGLVAALIAAS